MTALAARLAGRYAREALALGAGEVCALRRRGFSLRFPGGRFACIGDAMLGGGPLNAVVDALPGVALGRKWCVDAFRAEPWKPPDTNGACPDNASAIARAAVPRAPA